MHMRQVNDWMVPLATGLVLLVYGLNVPGLSTLALLAAVGATFVQLALRGEYNRAFMDRLLLLALFALSYYIFTALHGIVGAKDAVRNIAVIVGAYALGFMAFSQGGPERAGRVPLVLLLMLSGFITFSFLCVYSFMQSADLVEIMERMVPNFWDGSEINAPGLGANASLGLCLLSVLVFGERGQARRSTTLVAALVILVLVVTGVYVNAALQNRTPFLALAASLCLGAVIYWRANRSDPGRVIRRFALLGAAIGAAVVYALKTIDFAQFNIIVRFSEQRLETLRYQAWGIMFSSLHESLLGGRVVRLGEGIGYVHNLWLDVIWDAGIVPLIFLLAFHLKHLACFRALLRSGLAPATVLMIAAIATSFLFNFMQEPTLSASVPYFAASCFFLGVVLALSSKDFHA